MSWSPHPNGPVRATDGCRRILIVDDDPIFAGLAAAGLVRSGFDVVTAGDGVAGLERLDAEPFDVAVIDLSMPRVDGFRMIALIRASRHYGDIAILVASARLDGEAASEALAIGADGIETKPVDFRRLAARLVEVAAERRSRAAHLRMPARVP